MQIKGVKAKTKSEVPHFVHQVGRYLKDYIYIYIKTLSLGMGAGARPSHG